MKLNAEQVTNPNIELYDYVKKIVAAVKYKGEGDHEDVPSILRKFAKGYEQRIKELTEENERLREDNEIKSQKRANIFEIADAFERGRTDGARKMQERLKGAFNFGHTILEKSICDIIDQIAKEMVET